ncbi:hypothetical protein ID866_9513 [Astraeus odoratus]|nr:hypothetical protein ID866_9513 [Astraeus odoratus]
MAPFPIDRCPRRAIIALRAPHMQTFPALLSLHPSAHREQLTDRLPPLALCRAPPRRQSA